MRMYLLTEDYCGDVLFASDCDNEQLTIICNTVVENDENGVGETLEEICQRLFPNNDLIEIGDTESSEFCYLKELERELVCYKDYIGISRV